MELDTYSLFCMRVLNQNLWNQKLLSINKFLRHKSPNNGRKENICTSAHQYFLRFQFHDQLPVVSTTGALQTFSVSKIWKSERISSPGRSIHSVLEIKKETSHDMLSPCQKCPRARSSSTPLESLVANRCKDNAYETS